MASSSFGKREREKKQRERAAAKRQKRLESPEPAVDPPDTDALMERFRVLSEAFASGATDRATYEAERGKLFAELGVSNGFDDETP
jgi:hypothetical protein